MLHWSKALRLAAASRVTIFNQSKWFISAKCCSSYQLLEIPILLIEWRLDSRVVKALIIELTPPPGSNPSNGISFTFKKWKIYNHLSILIVSGVCPLANILRWNDSGRKPFRNTTPSGRRKLDEKKIQNECITVKKSVGRYFQCQVFDYVRFEELSGLCTVWI